MKKYRLLLVDDEEHLLHALGDFLVSRGFDVELANSAEKALDSVSRKEPDLVILDVMMPGIGGLGFLKRINEEGAKSRISVLVLTARSSMEPFFRDMQVDGFLSKTCSCEELVAAISEILARRAYRRNMGTGKRYRVLVGEDDIAAAARMRQAFADEGMDVEIVSSGSEIVEATLSCNPDAVLIKETIGGLSGTLLAPLIAKMPSVCGLPIVLHDNLPAMKMPGRDVTRQLPDGVVEWVCSSEPAILARTMKEILSG
ncbi:MAG: response regulator [Lentisphaerae bacterium]|nr:response regulator [Lentisphaerota bacterium]